MKQVCLRFYATERARHDGKLLYEWLLEKAKAMGVPGGTALRAVAGYGRHRVLHEESFFELAGDVPVEIEFVLDAAHAEALLGVLSAENIRLFYVRMPVEGGITGSS